MAEVGEEAGVFNGTREGRAMLEDETMYHSFFENYSSATLLRRIVLAGLDEEESALLSEGSD